MPDITRYELYCLLEESLRDEQEGRLRPAEDVFADVQKAIDGYKKDIAHEGLSAAIGQRF